MNRTIAKIEGTTMTLCEPEALHSYYEGMQVRMVRTPTGRYWRLRERVAMWLERMADWVRR
jgi:hypothetical protein